MPIFSVSSLGLGSITSLCFHSHILLSNDSTTSFSSSFSYKLLNFKKFSGINRYPVFSAQINASSSSSSSNKAIVDENLDGSPLPLQSTADWEAAKKYKLTGTICDGKVEGFNNGGLIVRLNSLVGFLPFSHLGPSYSDPKKTILQIAKGLIGSVIQMKVIDLDVESKKLVFSEKEATWARYSETVSEGQIFEGRVDLVEDYGAFLHLRFPDGKYHLSGLVHVSEVSWDYVQDVRDIVKPGDIVRAKIISIDRKKSRITLSMKQLEEDPLLETLDKVIAQNDATSSSSTSTSEGYDIQPLPGLAEILEELVKEDGINEVRIRRQGFEKRVVSQDLQLWLSNAPAVDNKFTLLARAGRQVQEIQMTTILDKEGIKNALQRVLERVS